MFSSGSVRFAFSKAQYPDIQGFFYTFRSGSGEFMTWSAYGYPAPTESTEGSDLNDQMVNGWYTRNFMVGSASGLAPGVPNTDLYRQNSEIILELAGVDLEEIEPGTLGGVITLNWARPVDGKVLSTTMEINVGAHTTESSSGTGGSGGGGTF